MDCKGLLVFMSLYLQGFIGYGSSTVFSSFYVSFLRERGVSSMLIGLYGMVPGIGYLCNGVFDLHNYLQYTRQVPLVYMQSTFLAAIILICAGQGYCGLISDTVAPTTLMCGLIALRFGHGYFACLSSKAQIECCRSWYPGHVDVTVGLVAGAQYACAALVIFLGGGFYQHFGFTAPFVVLSSINCVIWMFNFLIQPRCDQTTYFTPSVLERVSSKGSSTAGGSSSSDSASLHPYILLPMLSHCLINAQIGCFSALITPYLSSEFGIGTMSASCYLLAGFVGLCLGCSCSGAFLQLPRMTAERVMALGSLLAGVGVFLTFPGGIPALRDLVPYTAFLAQFLVGFGDQLTTLAALKAIEDAQTVLAGRGFSPKSRSRSTTFWLCFLMVAVYGGHMFAQVILEYLTFEQGGWVMLGFTGLSLGVSVGLDVLVKRKRAGVFSGNVEGVL